MKIGNKIRELRLKKSCTQEQLAKHLSLSTQCISKWENNVTMPDIQLLPELSVFFGVTIDELFSLTDDAHINRISNLMRSARILDEVEFHHAEEFLKEKVEQNDKNTAECLTLLSELYNYMAESYRTKAEEYAKKALVLDPEKKYNHSLLRMAQQGSLLDWNYTNHSKRIAYYQQFIKEYPAYERGYICLLDDLIADNRLTEAENTLEQMKNQCNGLRVPLYSGLIQWQNGNHEAAEKSWTKMLADYPDNWLAYSCIADCMAKICRYEDAIKYYRRGMELQKKPRYTENAMSIAYIYEIQGNYPGAVEAWQEVIQIHQNDNQIYEGNVIDEPMREIERLKKF